MADITIPFRVNGTEYSVRPGDVSRQLAIECLKETGLSHEMAIAAFFTNPGKAALTCLMWLSRRQAGESSMIRNGRTTTRLIDDIWASVDGYDDDIELLDITEVEPDPGT